MSGLEILALVAVAYVFGRGQQWQRNRKDNEVGRSINKVIEALREHKKEDKE